MGIRRDILLLKLRKRAREIRRWKKKERKASMTKNNATYSAALLLGSTISAFELPQ